MSLYPEWREQWREQAACRGKGPDLFFPDPADLKGLARAQLICNGCPVKEECADHAHVQGERWGVWAGVNVGIATDAETRARKNRDRAARRKARRTDPAKTLIRGQMHGPDDPRHGTLHGYTNLGCKCEACKAAARSYNATRGTKTG